MKLDEQQIEQMIEKAFEKWLYSPSITPEEEREFREMGEQERVRFALFIAWKAATHLLLPVIEKLQESNEITRSQKSPYMFHEHREDLEARFHTTIITARQTQTEVSEMLKKLTGED